MFPADVQIRSSKLVFLCSMYAESDGEMGCCCQPSRFLLPMMEKEGQEGVNYGMQCFWACSIKDCDFFTPPTTVKLSGSAPKSPGKVTSHREIVG